jgi:hypothetical protein
MFNKKTLKSIAMLLVAMALLACGLFAAPVPTPVPVQPTDKPLNPTNAPTSIPPTSTPTKVSPTSTNTPSAPDDLFDGRLGISVSKIELTKNLPDNYDLPDAGDNNTYVSIHLTVTRIVGTHITDLLGFEKEKSILHDDKGQNYTLVYGTFKGIRFSDPSNITSSYEFVEGAEGVLIFEIPEDRKPKNLQMLYTFQDSMEDDAVINQGYMTIAFSEGGTELLPQSQYGPDWQPIHFTFPSRNNLWTKTSDNSYTAAGISWDTFAWTEETYSGDLLLSFSMDIIYGNANSGGGCIIVFGDGKGWSEGTLIFCISGEYQSIQTNSVYDDTVFLTFSDLSLKNNRTYAFTIEILDNNASLYLANKKILSVTLPGQVNSDGRIGLYKHGSISKVVFHYVGLKQIE